MRQQILPIQSEETSDFNNYFVSSSNKAVISYLKNVPHNCLPQAEKIIYLTGKNASGISHVLKSSIKLHQQSVYVGTVQELSAVADVFQSERCCSIAVDNLEKIIQDIKAEKILFNLYNQTLEQNQNYLYFGSHQLPSQLHCALPDLKSRLQASLVLSLKELTDAEKILALEMRAKLRGFDLPREVSEYMLHHFPRDSGYLFDSLNKLDSLSLMEKRKLTIPFVKAVLF